jgi:hypothetical protein
MTITYATELRAGAGFLVWCWALGFMKLVYLRDIPVLDVFDCIGLGLTGAILMWDGLRKDIPI